MDIAERRLKGTWPKNPYWIYTTPDNGHTVYRAMRTDVCPDIFKDSYGQPIKQLYSVDGEIVAHDDNYGHTQEKNNGNKN